MLYKLGVIHNRQGSVELAEGLLSRALKLNANHQGSLEELGLVLLKQERLEKSEEILTTALERRPNSNRDHKRMK